MAKESTVLSLVDLYEESNEVLTFLETKVDVLYEEWEKWSAVLHSHIDKVLQSTQFLKIDTLGAGFDWLNTTKPLTLEEDLKDKVLVLDFFTYCCINCEHALPYLQEVEKSFEQDPNLLIIGVHSPKFPNEKAIDSVRNAVLRNNINHPVINDPENSLWNKLGIYCWPTVLILSPDDHRVIFAMVGEMQIQKLNYLCKIMMNYFKMGIGTLNKNELCLNVPDNYSIDTLLYPSGICVNGTSIIVSDTGHNRLLLMTIDGKVLDVIGSGVAGCKDGLYKKCSFNRPHGIAWWENEIVFVADTGNHSIRMININTKFVSTIFRGRLLDTECNDNVESFASPWDVCLGPELGSDMSELNVLYIAVAGSHQIWNCNLKHLKPDSGLNTSYKFTPFAGNGKEECRNNSYRMKAGFAQPSGICYSKLCPGTLFIADSESSTIRSISLASGAVNKVAGGGLDPKDLFQYGDNDAIGNQVKLQHPLGICVMQEGTICITDTYNHKLKLINVSTNVCATVAGSGIKGNNYETSALDSEFDEPSGICYSSLNKCFLVVDTNNHCIKIFDPEMKVIKFLPLNFTNSCCVDGVMHSEDSILHIPQNIKCTKINLRNGGKITCTFKLNKPGVSITSDSGVQLSYNRKFRCKIRCAISLFDTSQQPGVVIDYEKITGSNAVMCKHELTISTDLILCENVKKICFREKYVMKLDVEFSNDGPLRFDGLFLF